jgi:glycogen debranching enzyme
MEGANATYIWAGRNRARADRLSDGNGRGPWDPHADRALEWMQRYGDADGDGFIEYSAKTPSGLVSQGWKDSWDGINFADGTIAKPPIALAEVQGYAYAAYRARAAFAREAGDTPGARHWADVAARLKHAFNQAFWLPGMGWYAVALDRDKRPVDALTSNIGHCLWTGIADADKAAAVADHLLSDQMFSGWGIRTLATSMAAYNPMSYHNGSVWPHDNALCAAGLMRYGWRPRREPACLRRYAAAACSRRSCSYPLTPPATSAPVSS